MTRTCLARAAFAVSALVLAAPLSAQTYSVLIEEGDAVAGWQVVDRIFGVRVNDAGDWTVNVRSASSQSALLKGTTSILQHGQAVSAPTGATVSTIQAHIGQSPSSTVVVGVQLQPTSGGPIDAITYEGDTLMYEGQAVFASGVLPGSTYDDAVYSDMPVDGLMFSNWDLLSGGQVYDAILRVEFDLSMGLLFEQLVCRTGQVLPGQTEPVHSTGSNPYSLSGNAAGSVAFNVSLGTSPPYSYAIYRDDDVLVQTGQPCAAVPGRTWAPDSTTPVDLDDRGVVAMRVELDDGSQVIVHGDRLVRRSGDPVPERPGETWREVSSYSVRVDRAGEVLYGGRTLPSLDLALFLEGEMLVGVGDTTLFGQLLTDIYQGQWAYDISPNGRYVAFIGALADGLERAILIDRGIRPQDFCLGDGISAAPCPCSNETPTYRAEGCENSQGHGAYLTARGALEVGADDATFAVYQARPNQPGMLVQGEATTNAPFKDGVLCMGNPTERIEVVFTDADGYAETASNISLEGSVLPFQTRYYQLWYRDPALSTCGTGSNFTQGLEVSWQ